MTSRRTPLVGVSTALLLAALTLTACADSDATETPTTPSAQAPETPSTPAPTEEPNETSAPTARFRLPDDCTVVLPAARIADFERRSLELIGGPGADDPVYFADKTPEERRGGISCVFGSEVIDTEMIVISVAPLSPSTRPQVMDQLIDDGLNETQVDDAIRYEKAGDDQTVASELHLIRGSSWISVITSPGGAAAHAEANELVDEVSARVIR